MTKIMCQDSGVEWEIKDVYGKWINIKDKLPEDGQQCLIYHNYHNIIKKNGTPERFDCATFHKGEIKINNWTFCDSGFGNNKYSWAWRNGAMTYNSQDVDFWMPLPKAPEIK